MLQNELWHPLMILHWNQHFYDDATGLQTLTYVLSSRFYLSVDFL
jgi:hypothetical protein